MPDPANPFDSAFRTLIEILEALPFPYCLIGGLALGVWSAPRTTQDLDVLVAATGVRRQELIAALERRGLEMDRRWAEENPLLRDVQLRARHGAIPVDLLMPRDQYDETVLERRQRMRFHEMSLWVISPEDLILQKLRAGRPRDFEDALGVLVRQGSKLDSAYLREWAQKIGIREELGYCFEKAAEQ
jgi:hypothetical protein